MLLPEKDSQSALHHDDIELQNFHETINDLESTVMEMSMELDTVNEQIQRLRGETLPNYEKSLAESVYESQNVFMNHLKLINITKEQLIEHRIFREELRSQILGKKKHIHEVNEQISIYQAAQRENMATKPTQ